jgi:hypothetical protein
MNAELPVPAARRDWLGIACSGLCVIHCAAPLLLAFFGSSLAAFALFGAEWLHVLLVLLVPAIALWSLLPSLRRHGRRAPVVLAAAGVPLLVAAVILGHALEAPLSIAGGLVMISAHALNRHYLLAAPVVAPAKEEV